MERVTRRIKLGEIERLHPILDTALDFFDMRYLVPETALTPAGVGALLRSNPIPVTRINQSFVALGESRLLLTARTHLQLSNRIPVLDCTGSNSEATEEMIWARSALHYLYSAHHPRDYPRAADVIRSGIPKTLRQRWCLGLDSRQSFAKCIGEDPRIFLPPKGEKGTAAPNQSEAETPLDRIKKRARGE